jgi:hypothetical protein
LDRPRPAAVDRLRELHPVRTVMKIPPAERISGAVGGWGSPPAPPGPAQTEAVTGPMGDRRLTVYSLPSGCTARARTGPGLRRRLPTVHRQAATRFGRRDHRRGLCFPNERGQRVEAGQTGRPAGRHQRGTGLTALSASLPRHARTHALRRGADLATVRDTTLGHASIATTSLYLHARPEKSSGDYLAV